jgi:hypothetical protein
VTARRRPWLAVVAALAAVTACASLGVRSDARFHFAFTLGPVPGQYQTFSCAATASDLESGHQLTAPTARARVGQEERTVGDEQPPFPHLEVRIEVTPNGGTATCRAAVYQGGKLLGSDVAIRRS